MVLAAEAAASGVKVAADMGVEAAADMGVMADGVEISSINFCCESSVRMCKIDKIQNSRFSNCEANG